jgi:glutamate-5-semialdehyde dehydrogenase
MADARIPVLAHLEGLVHIYLHEGADLAKACALVHNAKMRRTGICGAVETLLIDRSVLSTLGAAVLGELVASGCQIRGDEEVCQLIAAAVPASEEDWRTEYLDAIIAVRCVDGLKDAIAHIEHYGSQHTDCIVTEDALVAEEFLRKVDSAIVMWNASTQFADGGEFGMGAEIGIATGRLHARGPVGAEQLVTFKYVVRGDGQCRD